MLAEPATGSLKTKQNKKFKNLDVEFAYIALAYSSGGERRAE